MLQRAENLLSSRTAAAAFREEEESHINHKYIPQGEDQPTNPKKKSFVKVWRCRDPFIANERARADQRRKRILLCEFNQFNNIHPLTTLPKKKKNHTLKEARKTYTI